MANYVKFFRGTPKAYANTVKNSDTLYFVSESDSNVGSLYLGSKLIAGEINSLTELEDILISEQLSNGSILVYDESQSSWVNKTIVEAIGLMTPATPDAAGGYGLVPAPGIGEENYFLRGDGTWAPIEIPDSPGTVQSSTQIFEVVIQNNESHENAINTAVNNKELFAGDIAIVKDLIFGDKYQYTAYVYNGTVWTAMDGNYRADNVYFDEDFIFTKEIGTVKLDASGNKTVSAAGKNLQEFFAGLFAEEENPTTPSTNATLSSSNIGTKEVGTKIGIKYSFTTTSGSYAYGPSNNGVVWSDYKATFNGETLSGASGTFTTVQVTDDTELSISGSVEQSAGAIPLTNLGNEYPEAQIQKKTWNLSKGTLKGFRGWFCGYKNGDNALSDPTAITGEEIRALMTSPLDGKWSTSMNISKMKQMYFAAPAGEGYKPSVKDAATTAPQTVFGPITVYVKGANEYVTDDAPNGIAYDVWYVANADAAAGDATVNIGKA